MAVLSTLAITSSTTLQDIADAIGMSYDSTADTLYKGEDTANGFRIALSNGSVSSMSTIVNGSAASGSNWTSPLYYLKTSEGCIFGFTNSGASSYGAGVYFGWFKATNASDTDDHFIFYEGIMNNYGIWSEGTKETWVNVAMGNNASIVSLAPMVHIATGNIATAGFIQYVGNAMGAYEIFNLDGYEYIRTTNAKTNTQTHAVLRLGKS